MADLGIWSGGAKTQGALTTSFAAPSDLFSVEDRNDGSVYSFVNSTSTLTLPASGLADGYLLIGSYTYKDTSNGRHTPSSRIRQATGTGDFVAGRAGGFSRSNSEHSAYVRTWAFINNPSASSTFQFQWRSDIDTATGGTSDSQFQVIPFYYSDIGMFGFGTDKTLNGGTTPVAKTVMATTLAGTNITQSSAVISLTGDNKRYLALGSQWYSGGATNNRTQRWFGMDIDGVQNKGAQGVCYFRNTSNDTNGEMYTHLLETATATITIENTCYRGDGTADNEGGCFTDQYTSTTLSDHAMVVLELNDNAEVFKSKGSTTQALSTSTVDIQATKVADIEFNDSASFARSTDSAIDCVQAGDMLFGANVSGATSTVSTNGTITAYAELSINGAADLGSKSGSYTRGRGGASAGVFGWSANMMSALAVSAGDDVSIESLILSGSGAHATAVQSGWVGFWGLNLDTLEVSAGASVAVSGVEATAEVGSIGFTESGTVGITGVEATAEVGNLGFNKSASLALSGVEATAEVGSVGYTISASVSLSGVEATAEVGNLGFNKSATIAITGVEATAEVGSVGFTESGTVGITGVEATAEVGSVGFTESGTVGITGVEATAEVGSVGYTISASVSLSGVEAAAEVGNVGFNKSATIAITGVEATAEVGSVGFTESGTVGITGVEATAEVGSVGISVDSSVTLSGVEATAEVGNLGFNKSATIAITGVEAIAEVGTLGFNKSATIAITGVEAIAEVGSIGVSSGATVSLTGVEAIAEVGSIGSTKSGTLALSGVEAAAEVGSVGFTISATIAITGVEAVAEVGSVGTASGATVALAGVEAVAEVGSVGFTESGTVGITGVEAIAEVGSVGLSVDVTIAITGVEAVAEVGNLGFSTSFTISLSGVEATAEVGSVGASGDTTVAVSGVEATAEVGSVGFTESGTVGITGVEATAEVGTLTGLQFLIPTDVDELTIKSVNIITGRSVTQKLTGRSVTQKLTIRSVS